MMRMDSEIQNIFAEHENTSHWQSNNNDTNTAAKGSQPGIVSQPPENSDSVEVPSHHPFQPQIAQQPQLPHNLDPVLLQNILRLASNPTAGNPNASTPGSSDGLGEQPTPPPPAQDGIFSDLIAQLMMQQQQQQQQQQAQSQNEYPDPDANKVARDLLLHQIVRLAGEYLSQEASSSQTSPHESTIRATLMLIQQLGHQYLLQVQQQQRRGSSIADVPFLQQLVGTLINHSSSSAVTSSLISGGQHQQQQQQQQGDQGGAPADPAFISLLLQNLSSMAGSQPAPGMVDSATIAPPLPGLLGGIIQQFQQQQPQAPIHQQLPSDVSRATGEQQQALQQLLAGLHHLQRQQQQGDSLTGPSSNNA